ncbi:hypothetical protein F5Y10DRAFT_287880 [Nemania abortiva]|nr:hypothetical protein F5Y10DRAFT_287880 [Nemania abortiva]
MRRKWAKTKPNVDYRHRWPTQQTLVDSRVSMMTRRSRRRWKLHVGWSHWLKKTQNSEPGKSTHPYDTGVGGQESDSESIPSSTSSPSRLCLTMFTRTQHTRTLSSRTPAPRPSRDREEPRPDTPKTPVPLRRFLTTPRNSPCPGARTDSPFDSDKPTVKSTKLMHRVETPAPPPEAERPVAKSLRMLSAKLMYLTKNIFRRRSLDWRRAACS